MFDYVIAFFIGVGVGAVGLMGVSLAMPESTSLYKQGQVDAINGKIVFELKKNADGTSTWVRK